MGTGTRTGSGRAEERSCRRYVGNGGDFGGKRKTRRQERVGSVASNPDNLENSRETEGGAQGTQGLRINCTSVFPLSRHIRGFHNKDH